MCDLYQRFYKLDVRYVDLSQGSTTAVQPRKYGCPYNFIGSGKGLVTIRQQAITWTNDDHNDHFV